MPFKQLDNRIKEEHLGVSEFNGVRFVIHKRPGCPRNACIEVAGNSNYLRCWACLRSLTQKAADYVETKFKQTDRGTFIVP